MADASTMTLEELRAEFVELGVRISVIASRRQSIHDEITLRELVASQKARIAGMSMNEKRALFEVLDRDLGVRRNP